MTPPEVVPAQVDREAAFGAYYSCYDDTPNSLWMDALLAGKQDDDPLVQAFARHRLAAIEEAAKAVAKAVYAGRTNVPQPELDLAVNAITAIRQLASPLNVERDVAP